jgi:hypothetical protein
MHSLNAVNRTVYITNALGFKGLLDQNRETFERVSNRFQIEIEKIRGKTA